MAMRVMRRDIQGAASEQSGDGRERVQRTAPKVEDLRVVAVNPGIVVRLGSRPAALIVRGKAGRNDPRLLPWRFAQPEYESVGRAGRTTPNVTLGVSNELARQGAQSSGRFGGARHPPSRPFRQSSYPDGQMP
jgi:hypothetical protein